MDKLRVLVVDDDDLVRAQLRSLLGAFEVFDLPSAIGVTRAVLHNRIDVVTIDVMMPSLSGDKLAQLLRQNPRFHELGVILISARPVEELEVLAVAVGADAIVNKAEVTEKLVPAVRAAAARRKRRA